MLDQTLHFNFLFCFVLLNLSLAGSLIRQLLPEHQCHSHHLIAQQYFPSYPTFAAFVYNKMTALLLTSADYTSSDYLHQLIFFFLHNGCIHFFFHCLRSKGKCRYCTIPSINWSKFDLKLIYGPGMKLILLSLFIHRIQTLKGRDCIILQVHVLGLLRRESRVVKEWFPGF